MDRNGLACLLAVAKVVSMKPDAASCLLAAVLSQMLDDAMKVYTGQDGGVQYPDFISNLFEKSTKRGHGLRSFMSYPKPNVPT